MTKFAVAFRHYCEYLGIVIFSWLVCITPGRLACRMGAVAGRAFGIIVRSRWRIVMQNLTNAFPEKTPSDIKAIARGSFRHLGVLLVETLRIRRMLQHGIHNYVEVEDKATYDAARQDKRGIIVATAHIGNWEVAGHAASSLLEPLNAVARPLDNPILQRYIDELRHISGQKIINKRGAVRDMLRVLKNDGAVAILMDQDARDHGIFIEFFGQQASTWPTAAAMALRLDCPIVFGFARRIGTFKYKLIVDSVFRPQHTHDTHADLLALTQEVTRRIEARIRECPEQWFWVHRRWKTKPTDIAKQ